MKFIFGVFDKPFSRYLKFSKDFLEYIAYILGYSLKLNRSLELVSGELVFRIFFYEKFSRVILKQLTKF